MATVRHQILVAGGIALLLALVGSYLIARALAQRVKRLELAAEQVAAGNFAQPIPVDSSDELGQLAVAFNVMQRQLSQLESARKKFIATASHELRTPIFSLGGFVELLEDEDLDPETRARFLEQVRDQVERLRKLSVDLLDLSRLESGSLELRPEQVDLGELTRSVSGEFEPCWPSTTRTWSCESGRADRGAVRPGAGGTDRAHPDRQRARPHASGHADRRDRAAARRARPPGRARRRRGDRSAGAGRIFEPFYTADDAQGSGLGLAIASELAERMAGRLSVDSQPGRHDVHARDPGLRRLGAGRCRIIGGLVLELAQRAALERVLPELGSQAGRARGGRGAGGDVTFAVDELAESFLEEFVASSARRGWPSTPRTAGWWRPPDASHVLVVDPIDGTRPAMAGLESACVAVALAPIGDGEPTMADVEIGCVVEIKSGDWYLAVRGSGVESTRPVALSAACGCGPDVLGLRVPGPAGRERWPRCSAT